MLIEWLVVQNKTSTSSLDDTVKAEHGVDNQVLQHRRHKSEELGCKFENGLTIRCHSHPVAQYIWPIVIAACDTNKNKLLVTCLRLIVLALYHLNSVIFVVRGPYYCNTAKLSISKSAAIR